MAKLIEIGDDQVLQLERIKRGIKASTGRDISYKVALEIYASKKPKSRISLVSKKRRKTSSLSLNDFALDFSIDGFGLK